MSETGYTRLCSASELPESGSRAFDVANYSILLCHTNKGFFAVENRCSHQTAELEGGRIKSCFIFCPLHGQRFDLRNGKPIGKLTDKPIRTFALDIRDNDIWINSDRGAVPD
ncbi:MAG: Rieske 2Fe-2S domain-containing protein [Hyphomonadaceae bacterium]|nr:Rieske 2Fe-2S domain-containing protein [Hyphomonadaceae bacterium]MBC6412163.1 Rieske 2Fe-2S domain-containing protein [Hyphomonadaceae bacterium]